MSKPFSENIFKSVLQSDKAGEIINGLNENFHYAFEFEPCSGEADFAQALLEHLRSEAFIILHINLNMVTGPEHLAKTISRAAMSIFSGNIRKMELMLKKLIPTASTKIVIGETEEPYIDFEYGADTLKLLGNLLNAPEMMGMEENRRAVFFWAGFGQIKRILREEGMAIFIEKMRGHAITSHVMTGSGIASIAGKIEGRMQNQLRMIEASSLLKPGDIHDYMRREFLSADMEVSEKFLLDIYELADGQIEHIRLLGTTISQSATGGGTKPTNETLNSATEEIIKDADHAYSSLWQLLNSRQKSVLYGLCRGDEKNLYSERFIKKYGFGTATNLQAAMRGLCNKALLLKRGKKWRLADPFFGEWIRWASGMPFSRSLL